MVEEISYVVLQLLIQKLPVVQRCLHCDLCQSANCNWAKMTSGVIISVVIGYLIKTNYETMRLMKLCSYRNQYKLEHHMNHNANTYELTLSFM